MNNYQQAIDTAITNDSGDLLNSEDIRDKALEIILSEDTEVTEENIRIELNKTPIYSVYRCLPGCMPDNPPSFFADFDSAKRNLISELKFAEDNTESEDEAEEFCHATEDVNLWRTPQGINVNGYVYLIFEC